jgi:hypothetical protein
LFPNCPHDLTFIFKNFKELRLEELNLSPYYGDSAVFLYFLRQSQSTLKSLSLDCSYFNNKMLELICDLLPNLKELRLEGYLDNLNSGLLALQKLKKLKKFSADLESEKNVLKGFPLAVNRNMLEIEAPLENTSEEFIAQFCRYSEETRISQCQ